MGWQLASTLQHLHNNGLIHGGLTSDNIMVSDELRITVLDSGLNVWIATARHSLSGTSWSDLALRDLRSLGTILQSVATLVRPQQNEMQPASSDRVQAEGMSAIIADLRHPDPDLLARDVQGRLGNLLLAVTGEFVDVIDQRKAHGQGWRRSIVDNLFDEDELRETPGNRHSASTPAQHKPELLRRLMIVAIVLAVLLSVLLLMS
ncbi:MAG: protein kinase [Planctomycetaceae bacterium]